VDICCSVQYIDRGRFRCLLHRDLSPAPGIGAQEGQPFRRVFHSTPGCRSCCGAALCVCQRVFESQHHTQSLDTNALQPGDGLLKYSDGLHTVPQTVHGEHRAQRGSGSGHHQLPRGAFWNTVCTIYSESSESTQSKLITTWPVEFVEFRVVQ
jgi:hypothetical protein